jgi:hypothetical protein
LWKNICGVLARACARFAQRVRNWVIRTFAAVAPVRQTAFIPRMGGTMSVMIDQLRIVVGGFLCGAAFMTAVLAVAGALPN